MQQNLPFVAIAAIFQKDPSVLIAHPSAGQRQFRRAEGQAHPDRRRHACQLVALSRRQVRLRDSQIRPYTFNLQPFLADKTLVQQGYLGSEPFAIEQAAASSPWCCCSPMPATPAMPTSSPPARSW